MDLNLAARPFVNVRPVRRAGGALAVLGALLAVVNGYLYWHHLTGQGKVETGLQEVIAQVEQEASLLESAEAELRGFEPDELNSKIEFVNFRILQRTFSWSRLFDQVAETLPDDVRLTSLTPSFGEAGRGRGRGRVRDFQADEVRLQIRGEARSSAALLEFVDRLFAHEAFANPDLLQEATRPESDVITFAVSTLYLPGAVGKSEAEPAREGE